MDVYEPCTRFSSDKYDMSEDPICSPLDLSEVNLQIREAEKHPAVAESAPKFVPIPSTNGCISLYHFPSGNQMKQAKQAGCTDILTLQNPSEKIDCISRCCERLDMGWIQIDFWTEFAEKGELMKILQLADEIIAMLKRGAFVMIHCAAGIHRTGLLAYIVLRRLGMPYKEAREYLRVLRPVTREQVGDDRIKLVEVKFMKLFKLTEIVPAPRIDFTSAIWKKVPSNRISEILNAEAILSRFSLSR